MIAQMAMAVGMITIAVSSMIHITVVLHRVEMDHGYDVASFFAVLSSVCGLAILLLSELMRL